MFVRVCNALRGRMWELVEQREVGEARGRVGAGCKNWKVWERTAALQGMSCVQGFGVNRLEKEGEVWDGGCRPAPDDLGFVIAM